MWEKRSIRKQEGKIPLGNPRGKWVDNIKTDLEEVGWSGIDQAVLAQDRDKWRAMVNAEMEVHVP
jgi:hypothetical protein